MTDRSGANRISADEAAVDAILLDVIVSPGKEEAMAGENTGQNSILSDERNGSVGTDTGSAPEQVPSDTEPMEDKKADAVSLSVVDNAAVSEKRNTSSQEKVDESTSDANVAGLEETQTADSSRDADSSESEVSRENHIISRTDEGEPVVEGESMPWTPPTPRIIDPEADADEIPPLDAGQGSGGTLPPSDGGKAGDGDSEEKPMTLLEHLGELRSRLVRSFLAIMVGFFVCYAFAKDLFYYLSLPLLKVMPADAKFIYTGVAEGFFVDLKVSFVAAVFVTCPFLFYQIWAFIAPGLYEEEKRYVAPLAFCSAIFFLGGAIFCYFVVFPFAFTFFMSYSTDNIVAMLSINEYLGFALKMLIAFGLIFEMPLFSFFLARMGIVTAALMRKVRKYAVLAVFIIAAILTPPDVFSQIMMAIPMLVLYEISILVAALFGRRTGTDKKKAEENEGEVAT